MAQNEIGILKKVGYLFYLVDPQKTSVRTVEEVPEYVSQVVPLFVVFILLEIFISSYKKFKSFSLNDGIGSISQGMLQQLSKTLIRVLYSFTYIYIYNNYKLIALPWNSVWVWFLCFLAVDFGYYWLHRAAHEINILWASHQVHHSSEYYNLTTALRQSIIQDFFSWVFYLPMALAIPPSLYLVHTQFNLLYQFWIHTELITSLGPLEYILNTPSHHRVHHGRNRYCIDKNYAGTLIIWDRLFGTFEAENKEVVYGLTHPLNTFEPFQTQFGHYIYIWKTFWKIEGWKNKISVIFKGPGWEPGKPWHGLLEDIPDVQAPIEKYNPKIPSWCTVYIFLHFVLTILCHIEITERCNSFSPFIILLAIGYQIFSLTSIGVLLEGRMLAPWTELLRCILFILIDYHFLPVTRIMSLNNEFLRFSSVLLLRVCFGLSALMWIIYFTKSLSIRSHVKKA